MLVLAGFSFALSLLLPLVFLPFFIAGGLLLPGLLLLFLVYNTAA